MTKPPTPLAILIAEMHRRYETGDRDGAVALARLAAPYLHPRIPPTRQSSEVSELSDADLEHLIGTDGTPPSPPDPT